MSDLDVTLQKNEISVEVTVPTKTVDLTISGVKGEQGEPADPTLAIQNQTTLQTNANFNIQSASISTITALVTAKTGQTTNLQEWRDANNVMRGAISPSGVFRAVSLANLTTFNNSSIDLASTGTLISVGTTDNVVLRVRGGTGPQTANLQEWQNSAGSALVSLTSGGLVNVGTALGGYKLNVSNALANGAHDGVRIIDQNFNATSRPSLDFYNISASYNASIARFYTEIGSLGQNPKLYIDVANGSKALTNRLVIDKDGLFGIGTTAPTHTITLPTTATGIALYNTADLTTNFERARHFWSSNVYVIANEQGGTGGYRDTRITSTSSTNGYIGTTNTWTNGAVRAVTSTSTANTGVMGISGTFSSSTGENFGLNIFNTINQSGTASYTMLKINPTETATGSGTKNLIDAQVGGVSKFKVDNTGAGTFTGSLTASNLSGTNTGDIPAQRYYSIAYEGGAATTNATHTIGRVYLQQIDIPKAIKVDAIIVHNGGTLSGNLIVGIYGPVSLTTDTPANAALVVESSSVAQAGANQVVTFNETTLQAGKYYLAFEMDNTTGVVLRRSSAGQGAGMVGYFDRAGGYGALTDPAPSYTSSTNPVPGLLLRCSGEV